MTNWLLPYIILAAYGLLAILVVRGIKPSLAGMTYANHSMGWVASGFSITATFVVSSMMILSASFGYKLGIAGPLFLVAAYIASYWFYGHYASKIKTNHHDFVTLSDVMRTTVGKFTGNIMKVQFTIAPIYSMIINLLGIKLALQIFGFDNQDWLIFGIIACLLVISYCWNGGLVSSIRTDFLQASLLILSSVAVMLGLIYSGSADRVTEFVQQPLNWSAVVDPGLLFLAILVSAMFSDVELHSRISSIRDAATVRRSFLLAAILTTIPMLLYGIVGGLADPGLERADMALPSVIEQQPMWMQLTFLTMIIVLLTSNLDSSIVASATMITNDWQKKPSILSFRISMLVGAAVALTIASLDLRLIEVIIAYTTIRLATLPAVVAFAKNKNINDRQWALSFGLSIIIGVTLLLIIKAYAMSVSWTLGAYVLILFVSSVGLITLRSHGK